ncbi:MAG: outer membrane protein transport protein [Rikenellaceae bacterium]|nr:outer membrane protein transport protein [Rikenellaceae bacterium]
MANRYFIATFCALALSLGVSAQTFGGLTLGQSEFLITDMVQYSQFSTNYGTARSTAMAGAFTSLGADLSSMSINPAGLGMYRSSEVGVTFGLNLASSKFSMPYGSNTERNFSVNNLGAAWNLYQGSGSLTSFTFGFNYNKLADYNYRLSACTPNSVASIADMFEQLLSGTPYGGLSTDNVYGVTSQYLWGAVLAYKNYLIDPDPDSGTSYITTSIAPDASVSHMSQVDSRGQLGEFNLSGGFNMQNKIYFGFSIGIMELQHSKTVYYGERYTNNGLELNADGNVIGIGQTLPSDVPLLYTDYTQRVSVKGIGINLKAGVVYRPTSSLRLGLAFHTPSAMAVDRKYQAQMFVKGFDVPNDKYVESAGRVQYSDELFSYCEYYTPPRLLLGASYTFGQKAILSLDYEHTWYNGMALDMNEGHVAKKEYKEALRSNFKGASTLRAGVEVRPISMLSLRGGLAYYGTMMRDKNAIFDNPIESSTMSASLGLGFNFGRCVLDLAYVFQNTNLSTYDLFYYQNASGSFTSASGELTGCLRRHQAVLTFSVKM